MVILESDDYMDIQLIIFGIIGFLLCFCGHAISEKLFTLVVFIAVASFSYNFVTTNYDLSFIWNLAIAITAGGIAGALSITIKNAVFYVLGFILGFMFARSALPNESIYLIVSLVIGVITAALASRFASYVLTIALSYFGAVYLTQVIAHFYSPVESYTTYVILGITALGFFSQISSIRKSTTI